MKILAIDTSCDETAAAITEDNKILSNIIWSQAAAHAKFGGVLPSLAQRMHEERIDFVIDKALKSAFPKSPTTHITQPIAQIDAIAVTTGPGLSIALGVGVNKAKELAQKYKKPLIPINHIEAHLLSPLAEPDTIKHKPYTNIVFPAYGLVVSGGNTMCVLIKNIGEYEILAETVDDALGEALDKGARMLGLGYPGGATLEKMAGLGNKDKFKLPIPLVGQEKRMIFSYSGLKTSLYRLIETHKKVDQNFPTKEDIYNLSATFQDVAFKHIERVLSFYLTNNQSPIIKHLLLGGGVSANIELRKRLRMLGGKFGLSLHVPYTSKLCGDNAAMVGVCGYLKVKGKRQELKDFMDYSKVDRNPRLKLI